MTQSWWDLHGAPRNSHSGYPFCLERPGHFPIAIMGSGYTSCVHIPRRCRACVTSTNWWAYEIAISWVDCALLVVELCVCWLTTNGKARGCLSQAIKLTPQPPSYTSPWCNRVNVPTHFFFFFFCLAIFWASKLKSIFPLCGFSVMHFMWEFFV